jgi:hypothetical protein
MNTNLITFQKAVKDLVWVCLFGVATLFVGCKSVSEWVAPRVEGRVLDAQSRAPIKDVLVMRLNANEEYQISDQAKGAQLMEQAFGVRTSATGAFGLGSIRTFAPFQHLSWYSTTLAFEHPAYQRITATFTTAQATNNATGEPIIQAGDILLAPAN